MLQRLLAVYGIETRNLTIKKAEILKLQRLLAVYGIETPIVVGNGPFAIAVATTSCRLRHWNMGVPINPGMVGPQVATTSCRLRHWNSVCADSLTIMTVVATTSCRLRHWNHGYRLVNGIDYQSCNDFLPFTALKPANTKSFQNEISLVATTSCRLRHWNRGAPLAMEIGIKLQRLLAVYGIETMNKSCNFFSNVVATTSCRLRHWNSNSVLPTCLIPV